MKKLNDYEKVIAPLDVSRLHELRAQVEARLNQYKTLQNTIAMECEQKMLDTIERAIARFEDRMFYIHFDTTHRIELSPMGNYYPQYLADSFGEDRWVYYHPSRTNITKVVKFKTAQGAYNHLFKLVILTGKCDCPTIGF